MQKLVAFVYNNSELAEKEVRELILFIRALKYIYA
jgi:hypothetical protein